MRKTKKGLASLAVAAAIISGPLAFNSPSAYAATNSSITDIGKGAKVISNEAQEYDHLKGIKNIVKVSFIDDPTSDKKYAFIFTDGSSISPNIVKKSDGELRYEVVADYYPTDDSYAASMTWPSAFNTELKIMDSDAEFYQVSPKNENESKKVSYTASYKLGGGVKLSKNDKGVVYGDASLTGETSWSNTVSYDQTDYKTFLETNTNKEVKWRVAFSEFRQNGYGPYTRDSYHATYGNELFMGSRTWNVNAIDNLLPKDKLPPLTGYGFQPSTVAIIAVDKDTAKTHVSLKNTRVSDKYILASRGVAQWFGKNIKDISEESSSTIFKIDWNNKKVTNEYDPDVTIIHATDEPPRVS